MGYDKLNSKANKANKHMVELARKALTKIVNEAEKSAPVGNEPVWAFIEDLNELITNNEVKP